MPTTTIMLTKHNRPPMTAHRLRSVVHWVSRPDFQVSEAHEEARW